MDKIWDGNPWISRRSLAVVVGMKKTNTEVEHIRICVYINCCMREGSKCYGIKKWIDPLQMHSPLHM